MAEYINREELERLMCEQVDGVRLDDVPSIDIVHCKDCIRNADNGGLYDDGRTKCPIQEHYALLKDGFCHLGERKEREHD